MTFRARYIAFSLVLAAILVGTCLQSRGLVLRYYAAYLAKPLPTASTATVDTTLAHIARLGEPAFPVLLAAMESPREIVAQQATDHVLQQAQKWENGSPSNADAPLGELIAHLAENIDRYPPSIRELAGELAMRVLQRPMLHARTSRVEIFAACDRILEEAAVFSLEAPSQTETDGESVSGRPNSDEEEQVAEYPKVRQAADWQGNVVENVASLPGGGLQYTPSSDIPSRTESNLPRQLGDPKPGLKRLPANPHALPVQTAEAHGSEKEAQADSPRYSANQTNFSGNDSFKDGMDGRFPENPEYRELSKPRMYGVMRTYATGEETVAQQAEKRLLECGFKPLHLRLTKRLFHKDPEIRRTLARILPDIPGVRAETWLLYLCHDREPAVRETALGMLLTLDNPAVLREAKRIDAALSNR